MHSFDRDSPRSESGVKPIRRESPIASGRSEAGDIHVVLLEDRLLTSRSEQRLKGIERSEGSGYHQFLGSPPTGIAAGRAVSSITGGLAGSLAPALRGEGEGISFDLL